jgi:hypothetical protein
MAERDVAAASIYVTIGPADGTLKTVYCLVSVTRNYTLNINDAASICNPAKKSPGSQDFSINMTLQRVWDPGSTHYSEKYLHDALINKELVDYTVGPATPATGDLVESGTGYITSASKTDNATDLGTMDITITCTEAPVLTVTP